MNAHRAHGASGRELSLNYRITRDQYRYSPSVETVTLPVAGSNAAATPTCAPGSIVQRRSVLWRSKRIKIQPSISNCVCGKRVTGCRKWRLVRGISAVRGCLMRNILLPAKPEGRSILRSAWAGDIWSTSGNSEKSALFSHSDKSLLSRYPATNRRDLSTVSQIFRSLPHCLAAWEYQTPWQPLRLKLEYEGNNYQQDFCREAGAKSKFNVGAIYPVTDWADVNL